jgi:hypothetical protein
LLIDIESGDSLFLSDRLKNPPIETVQVISKINTFANSI